MSLIAQRIFSRRQRGLAMPEFVISVPLLLLLMFAAFEFGNMMIQYSVLSTTIRDASRYLAGKSSNGTDGTLVSSSSATWTTLVSNTQNIAVFGNTAGSGTAILPSLTTGQINVAQDTVNNNVIVSVAYPYQPLFGAQIPDFFNSGSISTAFTLNVSTTMRAL